MKLQQITDPATVTAWRGMFSFQSPPSVPVHIHAIHIDGIEVGAVATEDYKLVGIPHIFINKEFRTSAYLTKVQWLFENVYCPLMQAKGMFCLTTNCDKDDRGTRNFMERLGFTIKEVCVAEYVL